MSKFAVIMPAAGQSSRFRDPHYKKPFAVLDGRAVWLHSADKFLNRKDVCQLIVAIAPEDREGFRDKFGPNIAIMGVDVVDGGQHRADSVANALAKVTDKAEFVAIHDAARPCIVDQWIDRVFETARKTGAAIPAIAVNDTLKRSVDGRSTTETVSRENLWIAQTPQAFGRQLLVRAFQQRRETQPTDEAQLVEQMGHPVAMVPGSSLNIKITTKQDLALASAIIRVLPKPKLDAPSHPFADDHLWR